MSKSSSPKIFGSIANLLLREEWKISPTLNLPDDRSPLEAVEEFASRQLRSHQPRSRLRDISLAAGAGVRYMI